MKQQLFLAALAALVVGLATTGAAVSSAGSDSATMNVTVTSVTEIDIQPNQLDYTGVPPGSTNKTSDRSFSGVEIENTGSVNITKIWAEASTPTNNPFGAGTASAYDAGNFVIMDPVSEVGGVNTESDYHYVNRKEFNETNDLTYISQPSKTEGTRYGRMRAGNESFFWVIGMGENAGSTGSSNPSRCSGEAGESDPYLRLGKNFHSRDTPGDIDFTDTSNYIEYPIKDINSEDYGVARDVEINSTVGPKRSYDVLVYCGSGTAASHTNSTFLIRTHYNVAPGATDGLNAVTDLTADNPIQGNETVYVLNSGSSNPDELQPGEHFQVDLGVEVPDGVAEGILNQGTFTVKIQTS